MSVARSTVIVGLAAGASRLLGFLRDVLIAGALGSGPVADAFLLAFRIPNLVRRILSEGGLNAGFVPIFAKLRVHHGEEAAGRFASEAFCGLALMTTALVAVVEVAAGVIIAGLGAGYADDPGLLPLATLYTRLVIPSVLGFALAALLSALLNAHGRFSIAAFAPAVSNAVLIAALIALGHQDRLSAEAIGWGLALTVVASGFIHLMVVAVAAARLPHPVRPTWPRFSPALRPLLKLGAAGALASGAAQIIVLAGTHAASFTPSAVSWLYYADRIFQLPLGLVGSALGLVVLSEAAERHAVGDHAGFAYAQSRAIETSLLLGLPACLALLLLAYPISAVLFERGAFTAHDAEGTAAVLAGLAPGLLFATLGKVLAQVFFARTQFGAPLQAAALGVIATLGAAPLLASKWSTLGIGLGVSLGCAVHAITLAVRLPGGVSAYMDARLRQRSWRILAAGFMMTAALLVGEHALARIVGPVRAPGQEAALLAVRCTAGFLVYAAACWAFGAVDNDDLKLFRRRA